MLDKNNKKVKISKLDPEGKTADPVAVDLESEKTEDIVDIYKQESLDSGQPIDMTKLDRAQKNPWKIVGIIFLILVILGGLSGLGYWLFNRETPPSEGSLTLDLSGVEEMASGDIFTLEITYQNNEKVSLDTAEFSVHYPDGFYFQQANIEPIAETNNTWKFTDIKSGAGGKITITGQLVGEKNAEKTFSALCLYQPSNFKQNFQELANHNVLITESVIDLNLSVPLRAQSGQAIEYKIAYQNTSDLPLPNVKITLDYPADFEVTEIQPEPFNGENIWELDNLEPGASGEISLKGVIQGQGKEQKEFKFKLGLVEPDGQFNLQIEKTTLVLIVNPELSLELNAPATAAAGQDVEYKVKVKNTSDTTVKNLEITLDFLGKNLTQTQAVLDKIEILKPGDKQTLKYTAKVKENPSGENLEIKAVASITGAQVEEEEVAFEQESEAVTKISSEFKINAYARYYDADLAQLGSGPLPPEANQTTTYSLVWEVTGGSNDLSDLKLESALAEDVIWIGSDAVDLSYQQQSRQVSWQIGELKAGQKETAIFMVSITPTPDDIGKLMVLTKETVASGYDLSTKGNVSASQDKITTDLTQDSAGKGKGVVVGN